jgi:hypothetical protein
MVWFYEVLDLEIQPFCSEFGLGNGLVMGLIIKLPAIMSLPIKTWRRALSAVYNS